MATTTKNLGLTKPDEQDTFNLETHFNNNWDKVDTLKGELDGLIDSVNSILAQLVGGEASV